MGPGRRAGVPAALLLSLALLLPLLLQSLPGAGGARVLGLFPFPGKSHFIAFAPLLQALARRGHHVTVVSAFSRAGPLDNYTDVPIADFFNEGDQPVLNMFELHDMNIVAFMFFVKAVSVEMCEKFLNEPGVQNIIQNGESQFDLVIYEPFMTECAYGLVHKLKASFMHISSNTIEKWMGEGVGNPFFYSYIPDLMLEYSDHMTFKERLVNTVFQTLMDLHRTWIILPKMDAIMRKHFPDPSLPSIHEIETNSSFLLLNTHAPLNFPRPLTPNTAEVGGMHLKEAEKLPENLQKLLDEAKDGVIYFSLGSNVRSSDMSEDMRESFLKAFSKLKQKVLWKWEKDSLPGQPKNVFVSKWFPQKDILGHRSVRAFITHGGLMSSQEALWFGVPLVAMPFFADQHQNARKAQQQGYAVRLDLRNVTEASVDAALAAVLRDPRYGERARALSRVFRDRPERPLERAVFWTEYVLRHGGAPHLRSGALRLSTPQYLLLDVVAVLAAALAAALALALWAVAAAARALRRRLTAPTATPANKKTR